MKPMTRYPARLLVITMTITAGVALADSYTIDWQTVDGGGDMLCTGGNFELSGTIGQPDASTTVLTGGNFELTGGFWKPAGRALDSHTTTPSGREQADDTPHVPDQPEGCPEPGASANYCTADIYPNNDDGVWNYADDGDCIIDVLDLGALMANYRITSGMTREDGDIYPVGNGDGAVDVLDLGELLGQYRDDCN